MLLEACEWLLTPCPATARRMGHLAESIAIAARARRCHGAWASHLEHSRQALLASVRRSEQRRVALLLGSGPLLDVPLHELAALFEEVWLVDLVHPLAARRQARRYDNVRLIEHDVSECLDSVLAGGRLDLDGLAEQRPERFLDEPRIDWVASLNLFSQLPRLPLRWLAARQPGLADGALQRIGAAMQGRHLDYLSSFSVPACLISDLEQVTLAADREVSARTDLTEMLKDWRVKSEWRWDLAPPGELPDGRTAWHRVGVLART